MIDSNDLDDVLAIKGLGSTFTISTFPWFEEGLKIRH